MTSGVRIDAASLGQLVRLAAGGQGVVYSTTVKLRHLALPLVFKEYKSTVIGGLDVPVLESMPTYLETLPFADGTELLSQAAWPCRLVENAGTVKGFVMPAIPSEFFLDLKKTSGLVRGMGEFQHLLNNESFLARRQIPLSDRYRYELLAELARSLTVFHRHQIAVGDLSPKNLLFSITPTPKVFYIDCDAMRFQGRSVVPQLETPNWEVRVANPGEELGTPDSDSYKFGLLALRLLVGNQETRDSKRLAGSVPKDIKNLVAEALQAQPAQRPRPADWMAALATAAGTASTAPPKLPTRPAGSTTTTPPVVRPPRTPTSTAPAFVNPTPATTTPLNTLRAQRSWWQRRSTGSKALLGLGLAAIVALVLSRVVGGGRDDNTQFAAPVVNPTPTTARPAAATTPTTVRPSSASASFVGTWSGMVEDSFEATLTIAESGGSIVGTLDHPDVPCHGSMRLLSLDANVATFQTEFTADSDCIQGGTHRLTLLSNNRMKYEWLDGQSDRIDSGELSRVAAPGAGSATTPAAAAGTAPATTARPVATAQVAFSSRDPGSATFQVSGGRESRYSSEYAAQITGVTGDGLLLNVEFDAAGRSDLRRPETSCVRISGRDGKNYIARPVQMRLTTNGSGRYVGTLTFPALISGDYSFNYSCASDYSLASLGSVTVPNVGVSRYSESYYAVVLSTSGNTLRFASHGPSDLRDPATSCVTNGSRESSPRVSYENRYTTYYTMYVGTMTFSSVPSSARFVYSCHSDYPAVSL